MNVLKIKTPCMYVLNRKWLHKMIFNTTNGNIKGKVSNRMASSTATTNYIERHLKEIQEKGNSVNVLGLVISNNNLCYCLLKNKVIRKIGIINIKKDINSYGDDDYYNNKEKRNSSYISSQSNESSESTQSKPSKKNNLSLTYNYSRSENPLCFNIKEILTLLNFIKLHSEDGTLDIPTVEDAESEFVKMNNRSNSNNIRKEGSIKEKENEKKEKENEKKEKKNEKKEKEKTTGEWVIGIEKVNEKYEKNKMKEKIISILAYFMQSIFQCRIMYFCPKEARRCFSNKCNFQLINREITYKYIKQKIVNFPSVEGYKDQSINYLFSDCYVIAFYTHRYYMHELVKNNRRIFTYLEKEVRKNKSFNNILNALKKAENDNCKQDLKEVLKDKIKKIVELETYKLVDRYIT